MRGLNRGKATRAGTEAGVMDKAGVIGLALPF